ncbi:MAG: hypothetical protein INR71_10625 [Terriglobus roseus]|nr:hypothetical protein [Terriglobus roseus]
MSAANRGQPSSSARRKRTRQEDDDAMSSHPASSRACHPSYPFSTGNA